MFVYLIETEIQVSAQSANGGIQRIRQIVVAEDAAQATHGILDRPRLAELVAVSVDEIETACITACITACDEHAFPKVPAIRAAYDASTKRHLSAR